MRLAHPNPRVATLRCTPFHGPVIQFLVLRHFTSGLAPLRRHQMNRDAVQIASETRARLVPLHILQKRQKTFLRQFLRAPRIRKPPPKKAVHRLAVAFEKLHERLPRSLLKLKNELLVAVHARLGTRCPSVTSTAKSRPSSHP